VGLELSKQRLSSGILEQQLTATMEASHYGKAELDLLIQVFQQEEASQVKWAAYSILSCKTEPEIITVTNHRDPETVSLRMSVF
jgi:hypothetical protein